MRKKSPTLVCRLSTSLITTTLEHVVPACNLPRGEVAEAAQQTAEAEAPHAAQAAQAAEGSELAHNPVPQFLEQRQSLLTHDEARRIAANGDVMTTLIIDSLNRDLLKNRSIVVLKWEDDPEKRLGLIVPFDCTPDTLRAEAEKAIRALARELESAMIQGP